jgi:hypothetical protein
MEDAGPDLAAALLIGVPIGILVQYVIIKAAVYHGLMQFLGTIGGVGPRRRVNGARQNISDVVATIARARHSLSTSAEPAPTLDPPSATASHRAEPNL